MCSEAWLLKSMSPCAQSEVGPVFEQQGIISVCTPEPDSTRAQWVVDRCEGPRFTVNGWVPAGFESYIQICPPAWRMPMRFEDYEFNPAIAAKDYPVNLTPVRWAEVAAARGHTIDEFTDYWHLTPHPNYACLQPGDFCGPLEETPTGAMIDAVSAAVLAHSSEESDCIVAVWTGHGTREVDELRNRNAAHIRGMGQQEHYVLTGRLGTALRKWRSLLPDDPVSMSSVASLSPQAIWPVSGDWFFAVPFDWHSSFFAGPERLTQRLLSDQGIEAYPLSIKADFRLKPDNSAGA